MNYDRKSKDPENLRNNFFQNRNKNINCNKKKYSNRLKKYKSFNNFNNSFIFSRKHQEEKDSYHKNKLRKNNTNSIDGFEKIKNRIKTLTNKFNIETELSKSKEFENNKKQFNNISMYETPLNNNTNLNYNKNIKSNKKKNQEKERIEKD